MKIYKKGEVRRLRRAGEKLLSGKNFGEINRFNKSEKLLKALEEDSIFETIFKISE